MLIVTWQISRRVLGLLFFNYSTPASKLLLVPYLAGLISSLTFQANVIK